MPWWVSDLAIAEKYGWSLEYIADLSPWWRARMQLWSEAQSEQQEAQQRRSARG